MLDPPSYVKPMGYQMHCLDVYGEKLFEQITKKLLLGNWRIGFNFSCVFHLSNYTEFVEWKDRTF